MTNEELKKLKARLWQTADQLRAGAGLKSTQYASPILGLIFLRFANSKYSKYELEILEEYNKSKGTRAEREIHEIATIKCGFYLPENARYDKLLNLPEEENLAFKIKEAMIEIEKFSPELEGVLPKDEYYAINSSEDKSLLKKLLKNFKDIPDNISIDIFGEIYEYFLGEFALAEGQGGGEFFTPSSVVRYMVEVLAPTEGKILDPACGSGGMFVQTAHYIARHKEKHGESNEINLRAYGVEKTSETVKLAKMNLALNNIRGEIIEANSYYSDPHNSYESFDYVMANPPFNVDEVELDLVKNQRRFNEYGVPQNKTKSSKKDSDKTEKVPNANYLWINQFATALRPNGRASLVMPNSASDAGKSEKDIRIKLIESGIISQMVTLPSKMFNTVTLPATLWFFNKTKPKPDEILFIDARNIFTFVDKSHRKFTEEQIKNLAIISRLYEGKKEEFFALIDEYKLNMKNALNKNYWQENIDWLLERFPNGEYQDIIGLCKAATIEGEEGIKEQDYSLNPGRYVGVVIEEDGMTKQDFNKVIHELNEELTTLNKTAQQLERKIIGNLLSLVSE
ncbi:class I SAM-dependent DNA methyltransferase [Metabacillus hrfriensis]|uniref:Class I SAM-dependent DNA methyltransferase n=1 Tax=Metabacillus hrfriensis TaxID=3048891 RepID=A0ACD4REP9_9BACI|nr:class I SAM-dependent DNA methyltransferase [Metabacillus sp. CT-WN-B3]WHZ58779.1 class I SAM-dependent DNA methyltransferase [Metabacillus sp. CT-WN-B3]